MDITARDVLYGLALLFTGVGVHVAQLQRVTRLEALVDRIQKAEKAIECLEDESTTVGKELAAMKAQLQALDQRVETGIAALLAEVQALRRSADRRGQQA